jgi:DNA-binding phage protein
MLTKQSMINKNINAINQAIESRGLKQGFISKQVGCSSIHLSRVLNYRTNPSLMLLTALLKELNLEMVK